MKQSWLAIATLTCAGLTLNGCSFLRHITNSGSEPEVVTVSAPAPAPTTAPGIADTAVSLVQGGAGKSGALVDRADLKKFEKVAIDLPFADVMVTSSKTLRKGSLRVQLLKGDASSCRVYVNDAEEVLQITDKPPAATSHASISAMHKLFALRTPMPTALKCRFGVELSLRESAPLSVVITRGAIAIENWSAPSTLSLEWGDIDVGAVGGLSVKCGRCTLAGEDVAGPLKFAVESGNVGLSGLAGSVEGQTLGDTILKWRRVKSDASVKLVSQAGDVILTFPGGAPLDLDLKAPRGDVFTPKHRSGGRGIPVSVLAEAGNVRLYTAGSARNQ